MNKLANYLQEKVSVIKQKVCMDLLKGVVEKTPVDTGRLRGNWQVAEGQAPEGESGFQGGGHGGSNAQTATRQAVSKGVGVIKETKMEGPIFIVNNLPYAPVIEYGDAKHEPRAMLRRTIQEVKGMFK